MRFFKKLAIAALLATGLSFGIAQSTTFDQTNQSTIYANLPACNANRDMSKASITDGPASATWGQSVTGGGGTSHVFVICNGTATTPVWMVYAGGTGGTGSSGGNGSLPAMATPSSTTYTTAQYAAATVVATDNFNSTALNTTNWNPFHASGPFGKWNALGNSFNGTPYSGVTIQNGSAFNFNREYWNPYPQVTSPMGSAASGIHLTTGIDTTNCAPAASCMQQRAAPDNNFSTTQYGTTDYGGTGFTYASAAVSSGPLLAGGSLKAMALPATGGYLQVRAKMPPDMTVGFWGNIWLLSATDSNNTFNQQHEFGYSQGGFNNGSGVLLAACCDGSSATVANPAVNGTTGLSDGTYHIYGIEYIPNTNGSCVVNNTLATFGQNCNGKMTLFIDGVQRFTSTLYTGTKCTAATCGGAAQIGAKTITLGNFVASPDAAGFHTVAANGTTATWTWYISDVKIYRLPGT